MNNARHLGSRGEDLASAHLERLGYRIIGRNVRTPFGEIDIVAEEGGMVVFVEVKTRSSRRFGHPKEAVDHRKRAKLVACGTHYLKTTAHRRARFDVVSILHGADGLPVVEVVRNAFGAG